MIRLLFLIPATYAAVCLFVYFFQTRLIYFPSRDIEYKPSDLGMAYEEVTLRTADGLSLGAWYVPAEKPAGTVLFCHGNAGNICDRLADLQILNRMRMNVLIFDYRGFGTSEGSPGEAGTYRDAEAAWQYLTTERGEPPERIVVFGRSLGGAVAVELASRHQPAALMIESTFTRLADVGKMHYPLLPVHLLCRYRYPSIERIGRIECPKLIMHGRDDTLIPIALGRALFDAAAEPKTFIETAGDHGSGGFTYDDASAKQAEAFIRRALAATDGGP